MFLVLYILHFWGASPFVQKGAKASRVQDKFLQIVQPPFFHKNNIHTKEHNKIRPLRHSAVRPNSFAARYDFQITVS